MLHDVDYEKGKEYSSDGEIHSVQNYDACKFGESRRHGSQTGKKYHNHPNPGMHVVLPKNKQRAHGNTRWYTQQTSVYVFGLIEDRLKI